jgi:DNA-binding HxlR family transcriptional regulator
MEGGHDRGGPEMQPKLARTRDGRYCPVRATLGLLGQRWVPRIVYELAGGKRRFNDLAAVVGGCNSRTLRDRLKELEDAGIVIRHIVATTPPWVEYELTDRGHELAEALTPLAAWGRRHLAERQGEGAHAE